MKLTVQHHKIRSSHGLDSLLEERVLALEPRLRIDEARVRLECSWDKSPPYRVAIHIITPGPDLESEGRDHKLAAAIGKAFLNLETRLQRREHNKIQRVRGNLQPPVARRSGGRQR